MGIAIATWNPVGNFWGIVEAPKAQCEAYDTVRLQSLITLTVEVYDSRKLDRVLREPQNTVSNLAFAFVGFAVFLAGRRHVSRSFGLACIFLSVGSGIYHASLLPEWRMLDILGVYAVLFALLVLGVGAAFQIRSARYDFFAAIGAWLLAVPAGIFRNDVRIAGFKLLDSTYVVVAGISIGAVLAAISWRHAQYFRSYLVALIVLSITAPLAFFGGVADRFGGLLANPNALIQGHTVWHSMGAVALWAAYEAYASTDFDCSTLLCRRVAP
jgi:hypothetical protein